jgi:PAS domain S-box-containing protein
MTYLLGWDISRLGTQIVTGLSDSEIRSGLMASAAKTSGGADGGAARVGLRGLMRRGLPLAIVLGGFTVTTTAVTMLLDDLISELFALYPAVSFLGELVVLALSVLVAMAISSLVLVRPIQLLQRVVQRLADRTDDLSMIHLRSPLREIDQLITTVLVLRSRLIADEQRAMRVASDMIQVAKASGDWLWKEDANHRFTEFLNVNASPESSALVEKRIGMTRAEVANHPDDRVAIAELQQVLDSRGTFRDFCYRRVEADGSVHWYSTSGVPTYNEQDEFIGYRGTSRDITLEMQIKGQQSSLVMLNSRLAAAIGQASDGVVLTDPMLPETPIAYVNPAFCRITGYDAEKIIGQPSRVLYQDFDDEMVRTRLAESVDSGRRYQGLVPTLRQDGGVFWNDLSVSPVRDEQGMPTGFVWTFCDVTSQVDQERKDAEAAARTTQQQKLESLGTLAGGIAHDLNNTLVPVLGLSKILLDDVPEDGPNRRPLQAIVSASERARALVRQILDFSRVGAGTLETVDLTAEVQRITKVIRAGLPATAALKFEIDAPELRVRLEPTKLYQILMNICINSFDALPEGKGDILVTLNQDAASNRAILSVRDNGAGMDKETLQRCMEPFFTTKEVGKGTGLGLSIIHGIITSVGGEIAIASEPGQGTTVSISMPIADQANRPSSAAHNEKLEATENAG